MMNKKLITLAVAAAVAAPTVAMAEATLYGRLGASLDYEDITNSIAPVVNGFQTFEPGTLVVGENADGTPIYNDTVQTGFGVRLNENGQVIPLEQGVDFKGWGANQQGMLQGAGPSNRVGVKGSEDLGNGLKAIYQLEFGVNFGDNNIPGGANGGVSIRNSFVGLAGSFGTVLLGRHDTPLKISTGKLDLFSDTMADYNGTVGFDDIRADNAVAYISPSFSGFSFMGAAVSSGGGTAGLGNNINSDSIAGAYSLAAIYNNGPFYASAAYEALSNEMFMNSTTSLDGAAACVDADGMPTPSCGYVGDDYNKWRFGLGLLDWNGFTLTAIYENQDNRAAGQQYRTFNVYNADGYAFDAITPLGVDDQQLWQVQAGYAFGNNMFKAMYGSVDRGDTRILGSTRDETIAIDNLGGIRSALSNDIAGDKSTWAVGFDHNFSKRTQAYVLYTAVDDDNSGGQLGTYDQSWSGFSLGMVHKF
jgi:predicted porin